MKTIKDKEILVGADFAGFPLKEAVCEHLRNKGWKITDVGVKADSDPDDTDLMFHRVGLRAGAMISEGEFERALLFCGTGMGHFFLLSSRENYIFFFILTRMLSSDFPGGPVAKTPHSQFRGPRFNPWSGN